MWPCSTKLSTWQHTFWPWPYCAKKKKILFRFNSILRLKNKRNKLSCEVYYRRHTTSLTCVTSGPSAYVGELWLPPQISTFITDLSGMKLKSNMSTGKRADVKIVIGHFKARLTLPRMHDLGDFIVCRKCWLVAYVLHQIFSKCFYFFYVAKFIWDSMSIIKYCSGHWPHQMVNKSDTRFLNQIYHWLDFF